MIKKLDWYIIKKFLGTFFFLTVLIIAVAVVFDLSEKMDDFIEKKAPGEAILFGYILNFIPYLTNLFSYLFVFISVVFFTSKMTYNSEIIAILSSGISFRRLLRPYMIAASVIAMLSFMLSAYVIPHANAGRFKFEAQYYRNRYYNRDNNIHRQLSKDNYLYLASYNTYLMRAEKFSLETYENKILQSKLTSSYAKWDTTANKWTVHNYVIRNIDSLGIETMVKGKKLDTTIAVTHEDFSRRSNKIIETMDIDYLSEYIETQRSRGVENLNELLLEKYRRYANPFAVFILTIIGVSLVTRKTRGGMGMHLGVGILLSFTYILFQKISDVFSIGSGLDPLIAIWIPNVIYSIIAFILYRLAPK